MPEVVVVGAGPGGMAAATTLADAGVETVVVDEQSAPGGQIYRAVERSHEQDAPHLAALGADYRAGLALARRFRGSGAAFSPGTSVWAVEAGEDTALSVHTLRDGEASTLGPSHLILAPGAMERATPFQGWTLPGVMTVGAAQTLLKSSGLLPGGRVVLAGTGPLLYLFAVQLLRTGARPAAILDTGSTSLADVARLVPRAVHGAPRELMRGLAWLARLRHTGIPHLRSVTGLRAIGAGHIEAVQYEHDGRHASLETDLLLVHDGVVPNAWLSMAAGCEHAWNERSQAWQPRLDEHGGTTREGITVVGDAGGIGGSRVAALRGRLAAMHIARALGRASGPGSEVEADRLRQQLRGHLALRELLDRYYPPSPPFTLPRDPETIVCRCEEVTVSDVRAAAVLGALGPNQGKAFTRCGMGPCMGRQCATTVSRIIAAHHELPMDRVGHFRIRPPVRPVTVGQLAGLPVETGDPAGTGPSAFASLTAPKG